MKQLFTLILCLFLALPGFASAENETIGPMLDLGDFTMVVSADTWYEVFSERQEGKPVAVLYPGYDPARLDTPSITVIWSSVNTVTMLQEELGMDMDAYADTMLTYLTGNFSQYGYQIIRAEVTDCSFVGSDGYFSLLIIVQNGTSYVLPEEFHISFHYRWFEGSGEYLFHLMAPSSEDLATLTACIDTVQPK